MVSLYLAVCTPSLQASTIYPLPGIGPQHTGRGFAQLPGNQGLAQLSLMVDISSQFELVLRYHHVSLQCVRGCMVSVWCVRACVRACVHACVRACVCVCVQLWACVL